LYATEEKMNDSKDSFYESELMEGKMKTLNIAILSLAIMIGLALPRDLYAANPPQGAAGHLSMAKYYKGRVAEQEELISEHQQMKADYKKHYFINEKVTPSAGLKKMEDHCDAIIRDAKKSEAEFLDFAKWHKMRAAELQGQ
jgi:hypothetical protein